MTKNTVPQDTPVPDSIDPIHEYRFSKGDEIADRYKVIGQLGVGGFSEVYHCQDLRLSRPTAVKVLFPDKIDPQDRDKGLQEARTAARLDHPNIVQVYDVPELVDETPLIIFRYVEGETLETRLNQATYRRLPLDKSTLQIVRQIAEALDYAHGQDIIHRDVKPSNILLDQKGNAYLTDFGLSSIKGTAKSQGESMLSAASTGQSGTVPYMAPEQLKEGKIGDERSDQYALGVVVYEMLTGQIPYRGRDAALIIQIATGEPLPPTLANPELPKGIEEVLLRALSKESKERYPSCLTFASELATTAQAYVKANDLYESTKALLEAEKWRQARDAFKNLQDTTPDFKDTTHYLDQATQQVRFLERYEEAQESLQRGKYQESLDTLNALVQMAPEYDVTELQRQAREGLLQEEKRSLSEQYQQAVQQFEDKDYQACLDTLAIIHELAPDYPDPEEVEKQAKKFVDHQKHLRELYTQGKAFIRDEQWQRAIDTLEELQKEQPKYEDVEIQLSIARHMSLLSSLLQQANSAFEAGNFVACIDTLDELQQKDPDYKRDAVAQLRQAALERLYTRAETLIQQQSYEEGLETLAKLKEKESEYEGIASLESKAQEGIRIRDLRQQLDSLYRQAVQFLDHRAYAKALDRWQEIQRQKGDLDYPDPQRVQNQARNGLCMKRYNQALGALTKGNPERARALWQEVVDIDPNYTDDQNLVIRAEELLEQQQVDSELRDKITYWGLRGAGALILIIVAIFLIITGVRQCSSSPVPPSTKTSTPTATRAPALLPTEDTPSPTPSIATDTPTPEPPTDTPTPTQVITPTSTPILSNDTATARLDSGIFAAPNSESTQLSYVNAGDVVPVLGRSAYGEWLYIRNDQGIEGFAYTPRFDWSGDDESLSIKSPLEDVTETSGPEQETEQDQVATGGNLEIDIWPVSGRCKESRWYRSVYIGARGGDGIYTYYWNGEEVGGPTSSGVTFEVNGVGSAVIGTWRVVSGDGMVAEDQFYVQPWDCDGDG